MRGERHGPPSRPRACPLQELSAPQETAGTLLLSVNPAIELDYDMAGDVLALNALNDDARAVLAGYDSYYGRSAEVVAAELVGEIDEARLLRHHRRRERAQHRAASRARQRVPRGLPRGRGGLRPPGRQRSRRHEPARAIGADDFNNDYADRGYISSDAAERLVAARPACRTRSSW